MRSLLFIVAVSAALPPPAIAEQTDARAIADIAVPPPAQNPVTIEVVISTGSDRLWSGSLRLGAHYGNASFSQSRSEYADPCPGESSAANRSSNQQLNLYINRSYSPQNPDMFNFNANWVRPVPECEGGGTNTLGIQRELSLPPGRTVTITGEGGLAVKLTRRP